MNYVVSILDPSGMEVLGDICAELKLPLALGLYGRGTASGSMLSLLGIESREKRVVMAIADEEQTAALIKAAKRRLYIDAPGKGVVVAVPVKSVGGGKTLSYLNGGQTRKKAPQLDYGYELILAVANEGYTDAVMDAARAAGAGGGTVLHAKGTGASNAERFFSVSIAKEKEIVMIVAKASEKAAIMRMILKLAGPESPAEGVVFSLPVSATAGFSFAEGEEG